MSTPPCHQGLDMPRHVYGPWHDWFAWHPVKTQQHGWRWLTTVRRALHYPPDFPFAPSPFWVYRPRPNTTEQENLK